MAELTPEQVERRKGARQVEVPKPACLLEGVSMRLAFQIRTDEILTDQERMQMLRSLPRNRAEARKYLKGRGPHDGRRRHA